MNKFLLLVGLVSLSGFSQAITMATFSDPAPDSNSPLFDWDTNAMTLSAAWTGPGFDLQTPGFIGGGLVSNTHFVMNSVSLTPVINNVLYTMGSGTIDFYTTNVNNPFFTITFSGGTFLNPLNASSSELTGNVVNFLGALVPNNLANKQFAFSLVNPIMSGGHVTYTAAFTSSADVVPEPFSILAMATGVAALVKKRRS